MRKNYLDESSDGPFESTRVVSIDENISKGKRVAQALPELATSLFLIPLDEGLGSAPVGVDRA